MHVARKYDYKNIAQSYVSGMSFAQICAFYGCSMGTVCRALKDENINIRPRKSGPDHPQYKNGTYKDYDNYIIAGPSKKRLHRVIIERHIQRTLFHWEHVHHVNGIKDDNDIDNLVIMPTREHSRFHIFLRNCGMEINKNNLEKYCVKENGNTYRFTKDILIGLGITNTIKKKTKKICIIDGCNNLQYGKRLCNKHYRRKKAIERGSWKSGNGRQSKCHLTKLG